jgi:glycyl-tRNA synthetase (class II)
MGCAMKANLLAAWRKHFVLEDHMLEVVAQPLIFSCNLKSMK